MHKGFLRTAAVLGALAVTLGAFGAHGLRTMVPPETVNTFETGVRYMFYHTFALLAIAILFEKFPHRNIRYAGVCFITGIVLFSGSLFTLTFLKAINFEGLKAIGAVTPVGGVFFIVGWVLLFLGLGNKKA